MTDKFNLDSPARRLADLAIRMPAMPDFAAEARQKRNREVVDLGYAHIMFDRLMRQIQQFEATLQPNEETAAYLASFGTQVLIAIDNVGYHNPYFITFDGVNVDTRQRVRLVQHVSQINVLFAAVSIPKEENRKARRIGFYVDEEDVKPKQKE